ncbi:MULTISPECIES: hypothetical protein [unclassified Pseudomonas]|uniref:hypothetical protein n=1 Tax=unclassified Pseudomonas TaxID=196821 RepID=UPI002B22E08B|nr:MULTISPECIES: hypothetical protein [unclassified Pseudomonas]MEA9978702.1 hypothetical protein [Pseudomonas sp. RTS4]MEB0197134.1 hypothetical protein [Pseudomonas sp. 5S4]MEB0247157.1 hypothetical protein [Pseudomonas sp. 10S5]
MTSANATPQAPQLVYLVFGADTYHQEAVFSIASALAGMRETPDQPLDIQVFSDNPAPYADLPVRVRPLDKETRAAWSAPHGYHFRTKHVALRTVLTESERALLIDTDTFFHCSPLKLFDRVKPGTLLCNAFGPRYGVYKEVPLYAVLAERLGARGLTDDQMPLLNSGVIGLMREDAGVLDQSIGLMDEFYPEVTTSYTLEEFCLSVAAYRTMEVKECTDLIHHYWSRKQLFRAKIRAWLAKHGDAPLSQAALDDTRRVNTLLPRPATWKRLMYKAITVGVPATQRQFLREILYGCSWHSNEFDRACSPVWWEKARQNAEERLKHTLEPEQLNNWLNHWGVRQILGKQRDVIYLHLLKHGPVDK